MNARKCIALLSSFVLVLTMSAAANAEGTIDFEGLDAGTIVTSISAGGINVGVKGTNPNFAAGTEAAMIFDSSNPTGGDTDLGSPNHTCPGGGPGIGADGELGQPNQNCGTLGKILIVSEDLDATDPDDVDVENALLEFFFNECGTATVTSIDFLDIEADEPDAKVRLFDENDVEIALFSLDPDGDNGYSTGNLGPTSGVARMRVNLNGSGAVDNIVFCCDEVCGNGIQERAEICDGDDAQACGAYDCREDCSCGFCGDGVRDANEACDDGNDENGDGCDADCNVEVAEGCTPGYWKVRQHHDSWTGAAPGDNFNATFGTSAVFKADNCDRPDGTGSSDPSLLKALWCKGGGLYALARHGTAALLNSLNSDVEYGLTSAEVKALVKAAIDSGNSGAITAAKNQLAPLNEAGCPLN